MNREEVQKILQLYRPGTADGDDSQIVEALTVANADPQLARWLGEYQAQQNALRAKFRQITVPEGLKEQILSERPPLIQAIFWRQNVALATALVIAAVILLAPFWFHSRTADDTFPIYRSRMVSTALRGYYMDLQTGDLTQIRSYLAQNHAPSNFVVPPGLKPVTITGCAIANWQGANVSMICFRTGKPLAPGAPGDLWLFVIDRASVKDAPANITPQFANVNRLVTAVWSDDGKLYLLGTEGDEQTIQKYL